MITNSDFKRRLILADIARLGLRCDRQGSIWRVYGRGVDVKTADIALLQPQDLKPVTRIYEAR